MGVVQPWDSDLRELCWRPSRPRCPHIKGAVDSSGPLVHGPGQGIHSPIHHHSHLLPLPFLPVVCLFCAFYSLRVLLPFGWGCFLSCCPSFPFPFQVLASLGNIENRRVLEVSLPANFIRPKQGIELKKFIHQKYIEKRFALASLYSEINEPTLQRTQSSAAEYLSRPTRTAKHITVDSSSLHTPAHTPASTPLPALGRVGEQKQMKMRAISQVYDSEIDFDRGRRTTSMAVSTDDDFFAAMKASSTDSSQARERAATFTGRTAHQSAVFNPFTLPSPVQAPSMKSIAISSSFRTSPHADAWGMLSTSQTFDSNELLFGLPGAQTEF
eukprot:m.509097 g.509097  ORF g.509097 m.509097 type:complete len:327 (+) comp57394_c0_seq21:728-1708(+)